jgi:hypothetical protein
LDEKVFKTYIGKYELAPNFHINIFSKSGQMFVVATGQEEVELLAIGDNKLMLKDTDIKITMNSTDDGVVNSLTLHQNGDHLAKKIE